MLHFYLERGKPTLFRALTSLKRWPYESLKNPLQVRQIFIRSVSGQETNTIALQGFTVTRINLGEQAFLVPKVIANKG